MFVVNDDWPKAVKSFFGGVKGEIGAIHLLVVCVHQWIREWHLLTVMVVVLSTAVQSCFFLCERKNYIGRHAYQNPKN